MRTYQGAPFLEFAVKEQAKTESKQVDLNHCTCCMVFKAKIMPWSISRIVSTNRGLVCCLKIELMWPVCFFCLSYFAVSADHSVRSPLIESCSYGDF